MDTAERPDALTLIVTNRSSVRRRFAQVARRAARAGGVTGQVLGSVRDVLFGATCSSDSPAEALRYPGSRGFRVCLWERRWDVPRLRE
jgi:hypothetical protein